MLEYILFHFIPRRNTNEIAHALIEEFGSFADVLNADPDRLKEVSGMTRNAAVFLSALPDIMRRYTESAVKVHAGLSSRKQVRDMLRREMFGKAVECAGVAALDSRDGLIRFRVISEGAGDSVGVSVRKVADFAIRTGAVSVVLAHNHPSGDPRPSQQDYDLTQEIGGVLSGLGVVLADHLIFTDNDSFSFEENGLLGPSGGGR